VLHHSIGMCYWLDTGFKLIIEFNGHLLLLTTNNSNTSITLHNLQITTAYSKSFQSTISSHTHCLLTASNNGDSLYYVHAWWIPFCWLVGYTAAGPHQHSQSWFQVLSESMTIFLFLPRL
jgi:hypothetical protein